MAEYAPKDYTNEIESFIEEINAGLFDEVCPYNSYLIDNAWHFKFSSTTNPEDAEDWMKEFVMENLGEEFYYSALWLVSEEDDCVHTTCYFE